VTRFSAAETDAFLNRMLEAERAGARALVVFMEDFPRHSGDWGILRKIHEDEAHNCALIGEQLKRLGRDYSHATGGFYARALAVQGPRERIRFLVKGLRWAIREFERALPRIDDPEIRRVFEAMKDRHQRSASEAERITTLTPN
jgi:nitronate monooxygenase